MDINVINVVLQVHSMFVFHYLSVLRKAKLCKSYNGRHQEITVILVSILFTDEYDTKQSWMIQQLLEIMDIHGGALIWPHPHRLSAVA